MKARAFGFFQRNDSKREIIKKGVFPGFGEALDYFSKLKGFQDDEEECAQEKFLKVYSIITVVGV